MLWFRSKRFWWRVGIVVGVIYAIALLGLLTSTVVRFVESDAPVIVNRLQIDFIDCPADAASQPGASLLRVCRGLSSDLTLRVTADGTDFTREPQANRITMANLPVGSLRMRVDGAPEGTIGLLSCRGYAQNDGADEVVLTDVPQIAYGTEPMTASLLAYPYLVSDWPVNRWVANAADPTDEQLDARHDLYGGQYLCDWFLFPPGAFIDRPGLVRTNTATDSAGEPLIHVLGPGGGVDGSAPNVPLGVSAPVDTFDFRSTTDGATATTSDTWYEPRLLPAGTWVVTDRTTGHTATVDIASGQTTRVVSITAIAPPGVATPAATPLP